VLKSDLEIWSGNVRLFEGSVTFRHDEKISRCMLKSL
jgi:hypothetical protein